MFENCDKIVLNKSIRFIDVELITMKFFLISFIDTSGTRLTLKHINIPQLLKIITSEKL